MSQHDIGLIGLAVMGQNLVLNMANNGFSVGVFNRTAAKTDEFLGDTAKGKSISGYHTLPELVKHLNTPRRIMMMVKAGPPVDDLIKELTPLLDKDTQVALQPRRATLLVLRLVDDRAMGK